MRGHCQALQALHNFLILCINALSLMLLRDEIQGAFRLQNTGALNCALTRIGFQGCTLLVQVVVVSAQYFT